MTQNEKNRPPRSRAWWSKHIEAWQKSGMTMIEYAKQNDLKLESLYRWKAELIPKKKGSTKNKRAVAMKKEADKKPEKIQFVEVSVGPKHTPPLELVAPNGWSIRFSLDIGNKDISRLVSILEERS